MALDLFPQIDVEELDRVAMVLTFRVEEVFKREGSAHGAHLEMLLGASGNDEGVNFKVAGSGVQDRPGDPVRAKHLRELGFRLGHHTLNLGKENFTFRVAQEVAHDGPAAGHL